MNNIMEKTLKEWSNSFPRDVRNKFLRNLRNKSISNSNENEICKSKSIAILCSFNWTSSPEGYDFWKSQYQFAILSEKIMAKWYKFRKFAWKVFVALMLIGVLLQIIRIFI